jgi:hypothetical protein
MSEYFGSLEAVGEEFKKADDIENESLFVKGRIVKRATEQGFDIDETIGYCAGMTQQDKRTIYRYYSVARTFPERLYGLRHELHAIAADTIDYRKEMTAAELLEAQKNALGWLKMAAQESLSTRALKAAIKAAGGRVDEKPIVLLDGVSGVFGTIARPVGDIELTELSVHIPRDFYDELCNIKDGEEIKITLLKAPTEEKVT